MNKRFEIRLLFVVTTMLFMPFAASFGYADAHAEASILQTATVVFVAESADAEQVYPKYEADYMELAIKAIAEGDIETAQLLLERRNEKISALGLEYIPIDAAELVLLSKIITTEAGSSWLSDEWQQLVGSVVLNRTASPEFPNTIIEVIEQPGQYYGSNSSYFKKLIPYERAVHNALWLLENGSIAPADVVFQAEFKQGSGVYTSMSDSLLGTTYFCYSSYRGLYE